MSLGWDNLRGQWELMRQFPAFNAVWALDWVAWSCLIAYVGTVCSLWDSTWWDMLLVLTLWMSVYYSTRAWESRHNTIRQHPMGNGLPDSGTQRCAGACDGYECLLPAGHENKYHWSVDGSDQTRAWEDGPPG